MLVNQLPQGVHTNHGNSALRETGNPYHCWADRGDQAGHNCDPKVRAYHCYSHGVRELLGLCVAHAVEVFGQEWVDVRFTVIAEPFKQTADALEVL